MTIVDNIHTAQNRASYISQAREHTKLALKPRKSSAAHKSDLLTEVLVLIFNVLTGPIQISVIG